MSRGRDASRKRDEQPSKAGDQESSTDHASNTRSGTFTGFLTGADRAVSPVIAVILMVAVTVILAAVIATFVLGLGESVGETAPAAAFETEFDDGEMTIVHRSGDTIQGEFLDLEHDDPFAEPLDAEFPEELSAGSTVTVTPPPFSTVTLTYDDPQTQESFLLDETETPGTLVKISPDASGRNKTFFELNDMNVSVETGSSTTPETEIDQFGVEVEGDGVVNNFNLDIPIGEDALEVLIEEECNQGECSELRDLNDDWQFVVTNLEGLGLIEGSDDRFQQRAVFSIEPQD